MSAPCSAASMWVSITEDDIKAKFENGVLSLMIPKKEAPKVPEKKQILIEG